MKIGDEIYVHGFIDEIRTDTVIVENRGGYFGTVQDEITDTIPIKEKELLRGYWELTTQSNGWNEWSNLKCPICGNIFEHVFWPSTYKYCPNCKTRLNFKEED